VHLLPEDLRGSLHADFGLYIPFFFEQTLKNTTARFLEIYNLQKRYYVVDAPTNAFV
jgi:hypothetical protein